MVDKKNQNNDEDVVLETEDATPLESELVDVEELVAEKLKSSRDKLKACEEEKRTALEDLQRAKADFLNGRKRLEEQLMRDRIRITSAHIEELLPLADSFNMAISSPTWDTVEERWRKGVEGILMQLSGILKGYGVTTIETTGVPFNPALHEAVANVEVKTTEEIDTVVTILQKGYKQGDVVIRPAKVTVGVLN